MSDLLIVLVLALAACLYGFGYWQGRTTGRHENLRRWAAEERTEQDRHSAKPPGDQ